MEVRPPVHHTATICLQYTFSKCLTSTVLFPCALHDTWTLQKSLHYNCLRTCDYVLGSVRGKVTWNLRDMSSWSGAPPPPHLWCSQECSSGVEASGIMPWTSTYPGHSHLWDSSRNAYLHSWKNMSSNLCCTHRKLTQCWNLVKPLYYDLLMMTLEKQYWFNHSHNKKVTDKSKPHTIIPLIRDMKSCMLIKFEVIQLFHLERSMAEIGQKVYCWNGSNFILDLLGCFHPIVSL